MKKALKTLGGKEVVWDKLSGEFRFLFFFFLRGRPVTSLSTFLFILFSFLTNTPQRKKKNNSKSNAVNKPRATHSATPKKAASTAQSVVVAVVAVDEAVVIVAVVGAVVGVVDAAAVRVTVKSQQNQTPQNKRVRRGSARRWNRGVRRIRGLGARGLVRRRRCRVVRS